MKRFLLFFISISSVFFLLSNTAQPGVWNAGGSGSFTLLYPEDSIAYKKIQMQSEKIYIQLYKGYAVVKGTYYFYNTSNDTLTIKAGYPVNNVFKHVTFNKYANEVSVEGLYKVKGQLNNQEIPIYKRPNIEHDNWYVWEVPFPPKKITLFTVYFLVNTNNAKIIEGYNSDDRNAFIYLIETGSLWKSPIEKGAFYTQIMDKKINPKNIKGSVPAPLTYNSPKKVLKFTMTDYGKQPDKNFVLTYGETIKDFNFKKITEQSDTLFTKIDKFSELPLNDYLYAHIKLETPYEVAGTEGFFVVFLYFFFIFGIPLIVIIITILILYYLYKKFIK